MNLVEVKERIDRYWYKIKWSSTSEQKELYKTLFFNLLEEYEHLKKSEQWKKTNRTENK